MRPPESGRCRVRTSAPELFGWIFVDCFPAWTYGAGWSDAGMGELHQNHVTDRWIFCHEKVTIRLPRASLRASSAGYGSPRFPSFKVSRFADLAADLHHQGTKGMLQPIALRLRDFA
jgi:hypothetical protein